MNKPHTHVPFLDLRVTDKAEKTALLAAVEAVLDHGRMLLGPEVESFEHEIARRCGRACAVGVNSGTDALILGMQALGIGSGDEVITTSLSWVATASAIVQVGATPVFADIGDDLNIDPRSAERMITKRTKAILPVHFTGRLCDMDALMQIARKHHLLIVEDAAQSFGAQRKMRNGQMLRAGQAGTIACFSMNPMKVLGALGEAGAVVTDSKRVRDRLEKLRYHGTVNKETCVEVSHNGRLDTVQAAALLVRLKYLKETVERRNQIARMYSHRLRSVTGVLYLPDSYPDETHVYYTYTIRVKKRAALMKYMAEKGIETKIQHPILMPMQPVHKQWRRDDLSVSKRCIRQIVSIPVHEKLTDAQVEYVSDAIKGFYA